MQENSQRRIGEADTAKMKDHTFSICAYGESPYLENCIRSLLRQTVESNILIVSSEPNAQILRMSDKYGIPYYRNTGEPGITQDWNFGYHKAHTCYVTIAHQDDIYEKSFLENQMRALKKADHPLIGFTDYYEIRNGEKCPGGKILKVKRLMLMPLLVRRLQSSVWTRRRILSFGSPICCPSVTYVKDNLPHQIFQNHFQAAEDWEAWERLSVMKGEFVYTPKLLVGHRIHEGSTTSAIIHDRKRSEEELQMFRKFWPEPLAEILGKLYASSQDSNDLSQEENV